MQSRVRLPATETVWNVFPPLIVTLGEAKNETYNKQFTYQILITGYNIVMLGSGGNSRKVSF